MIINTNYTIFFIVHTCILHLLIYNNEIQMDWVTGITYVNPLQFISVCIQFHLQVSCITICINKCKNYQF